MDIQQKKNPRATKADEDFDLSIINGASAVAYDTPEPIRAKRVKPGSSGYGDDDDYNSNTAEGHPGPNTTPPFSPTPNPNGTRPHSPQPLATPPCSPGPTLPVSPRPLATPPCSPGPTLPNSPDPLATPPHSPGPTRPYSPGPLATSPHFAGPARPYTPNPLADLLVTPPYSPEPTRPHSPDPLATPPDSLGPARPYSPDPLATPPHSAGPARPYSPDSFADILETPPYSPEPTRPHSPDPLATPPNSLGPARPYSPDPHATPPDSPRPTRPYFPGPLATPPHTPGPATNTSTPTPPGTPTQPLNQPATPPNSAGGTGHVVVEIEEQPGNQIESQEDETESPFYSFFKIVNFACLSPYRFNDSYENKTFLKMLPYCIVHIFLAVYHLVFIKYHIMFGSFITGTSNIALYIDFARLLLQPCFGFSVAFTVLRRFGSFKGTLEECRSSIHFRLFKKLKTRVIVAGIIALGWIIASLNVIITVPMNNSGSMSNLEWIPTYHSHQVIYLLSTDSYTEFLNATSANKEETNRGFAVAFGIFVCMIKTVNLCLEQMGSQLIMISACTLKHFSDRFHVILSSKLHNISDTSGDEIKAAYRNLKRISKCLNDSISAMYPLFLADSLLTIASFYNQSFDPDVSIWTKMLSLLKVINISLTFWIAERLTNPIMQFRDWLLDESQPILSQEEATHLRDDIQTNPIGIGKDSLLITKDFVISFFGISTAYFLSVVETRYVAAQ